jgi:hypothetical protein
MAAVTLILSVLARTRMRPLSQHLALWTFVLKTKSAEIQEWYCQVSQSTTEEWTVKEHGNTSSRETEQVSKTFNYVLYVRLGIFCYTFLMTCKTYKVKWVFWPLKLILDSVPINRTLDSLIRKTLTHSNIRWTRAQAAKQVF